MFSISTLTVFEQQMAFVRHKITRRIVGATFQRYDNNNNNNNNNSVALVHERTMPTE
jgi:hypothetical protein